MHALGDPCAAGGSGGLAACGVSRFLQLGLGLGFMFGSGFEFELGSRAEAVASARAQDVDSTPGFSTSQCSGC